MKLLQLFFISYCFLFSIVLNAQKSTRVVGYVPTWGNFAYYSTNLAYNKLSHINLSFANPNANGDLDEGLSDVALNAFMDKAHLEGVAVLISVGGATAPDYWHDLMKQENRTAFIVKLMDYLKKYDFDGIDVDLEGSDITADYKDFIIELSVETQKEGLLLTAALASWNGNTIPDQVLSAFDFINLMAYDATGPWNLNNPGQHSSISFAQQNLDYWVNTRGVPAENCVLGVPFYGYNFDASGKGVAYKTVVSSNAAAAYQDQVGNIFYNGKPTIGAKTTLGINNYGGIMIWELTQDIEGEHSLLDTIYQTIVKDNYQIGTSNRAPQITITKPSNNGIVFDGDTVVIEANAFDVDGEISYVAFILGLDTVARFYNQGPFIAKVPDLPVGDYTLVGFARDTTDFLELQLNLHLVFKNRNHNSKSLVPQRTIYNCWIVFFPFRLKFWILSVL